MANVHRKADWLIPERDALPEATFLNRRQVLAGLGFGAAGLAGLGVLPAQGATDDGISRMLETLKPLPAQRNEAFTAERPMTPLRIAAQFNNFYEFSREKDDVWLLAQKLRTDPWKLEVSGLVNKPRTFDLDDLRAMPLEERVYRFRCVEAWSMVVPWVGFPMAHLLKQVDPQGSAKYVRFTTFMDPAVAPRQSEKSFFGAQEPYPYTEGLTLAEAMNPLTLLTVGIYGRVLPNQNGAPVRLIVPWKYGFKNIKSIVKIELTDTRPATFWNTIAPREYGFESNVNPQVPHPRWSQATERDIGTKKRIPTQLYNGYAAQVGSLYS